MVEKEPHGTTTNNILSHRQIKVKVSFSPWRDKTSQNMATINVASQKRCTIATRDGRNTFKNILSLKAFPLLGYCKKMLLNCMVFLEARGSYSAIQDSQNPSRSAPLKNKPCNHMSGAGW